MKKQNLGAMTLFNTLYKKVQFFGNLKPIWFNCNLSALICVAN